jgi:hypothetical protein
MSANFTYTTAAQAGGVRLDKAFGIINQMVADGVIENYAIGGATAAFFYIEPDTTFDVDIFCVLTGFKKDAIDMLQPIYDYLRQKNYHPEAEAVSIEGAAVQFLPVHTTLNEEAVEQANVFDYEGVPVRVMTPEHLVGIMLQTGRPKDYVRVARFVSADAFNPNTLRIILNRHGLEKEWSALRAVKRRLGT